MAQVRMPANVTSITLPTSGAVVPVSGLITCTAAEATNLCSAEQNGPGQSAVVKTNLATGNYDFFLPSNVSSITINGNVYVPSGSQNIISNVPAADGLVYLHRFSRRPAGYELVVG